MSLSSTRTLGAPNSSRNARFDRGRSAPGRLVSRTMARIAPCPHASRLTCRSSVEHTLGPMKHQTQVNQSTQGDHPYTAAPSSVKNCHSPCSAARSCHPKLKSSTLAFARRHFRVPDRVKSLSISLCPSSESRSQYSQLRQPGPSHNVGGITDPVLLVM